MGTPPGHPVRGSRTIRRFIASAASAPWVEQPLLSVSDTIVPPPNHSPTVAPPSTAMTPLERRSSISLALIFALRMLGLFLVLPVFALEARKYPGGDDPALVGLAMGI